MTPQTTNSLEGGAPAVAEASTSHLGRAREPEVKEAPKQPRVLKSSTINRRFPILIDTKIADNAVFSIKLLTKIYL